MSAGLGALIAHVTVWMLLAYGIVASLAAGAAWGQAQPPELRVLFIGNSLTAANDLPGMVERIARNSGWKGRLTCEQVTRDNASLEDHWTSGDAVRAIRRGGWTHVVLQQGPSSLPGSQVALREYTAKFAREIEGRGAAVVLYGVWPPRQRLAFQPAVTEGYRRAAADVGGRLVAVGDGWAAAWQRDPSLPLYAADQFHPSAAGTYLGALMFVESLTGHSLDGLSPAARRTLAPRGLSLGDGQLAALHAAAASRRQPAEAEPSIAITVDDLPTVSALGNEIQRAERTTRDLLAALRRAQVPAIGFVNEGKLLSSGAVDPRRVALLQQWIDAGFDLGNHTYAHPDLHRIDVEAFAADIVKGEQVTRGLVAAAGKQPRYFRHPFLHTGRSREVRDRVDAELTRLGYTVAPVTIDNYDYTFAAAFDRASASNDAALTDRIVAAYLDYMIDVVEYYEQQSLAIVGRPMAHTLLLHANALNALTIERLVARLRARGYRFVTLDEALKDPAYASKDEYFGPAGVTWLHRWALTQGRRGIFAGEPVVPDWIEKAAAGRD